ncbi:hypothetical protein BDL97_12G058900 [Sphagnum fallax]|nr:hypothetical protein BDL97_12G058900 [Sphagnum fallax]
MAYQTAWSTEYFDDRPLEYKAQVETAAAASPRTAVPVGNPPPMYTTGNSNSAAGRNTGSVSSCALVCFLLVPRVLQVIFLIIAMSVTAAIPDFTDFSSFKFLLSMHVIALVYSLAVLVWVIICLVSWNSQFGGTGSFAAYITCAGYLATYITFILDLLLACTLGAAGVAAAVVTVDVDGGANCGSPCSEQNAAVSMGQLTIGLLGFSAGVSRSMMQSTTALRDVAEQ